MGSIGTKYYGVICTIQCRKQIRHFYQVIVSQVMACCQRHNENAVWTPKKFEGGHTWEFVGSRLTPGEELQYPSGVNVCSLPHYSLRGG
jgi:hypothetical protein